MTPRAWPSPQPTAISQPPHQGNHTGRAEECHDRVAAYGGVGVSSGVIPLGAA